MRARRALRSPEWESFNGFVFPRQGMRPKRSRTDRRDSGNRLEGGQTRAGSSGREAMANAVMSCPPWLRMIGRASNRPFREIRKGGVRRRGSPDETGDMPDRVANDCFQEWRSAEDGRADRPLWENTVGKRAFEVTVLARLILERRWGRRRGAPLRLLRRASRPERCRLLLRLPLGAPALRRGPSESGPSLALPARSDGPRGAPQPPPLLRPAHGQSARSTGSASQPTRPAGPQARAISITSLWR